MRFPGHNHHRRRRHSGMAPLPKAFLDSVQQIMQLSDEQLKWETDGFSWQVARLWQHLAVSWAGASRQPRLARAHIRMQLTQPVAPRPELFRDLQQANRDASAYAWVWNPDTGCVEMRSSFHLHHGMLPVTVEPAAYAAGIQAVDGEAMLSGIWPSLSLKDMVMPWLKRPELVGRLVALLQAPDHLAEICPENLRLLLLSDADQAAAVLQEQQFDLRLTAGELQVVLPDGPGFSPPQAWLTVSVVDDPRLGGSVLTELSLLPERTLGDRDLNALNIADQTTRFPCHGNGAWVLENGLLMHRSRLPGVFHKPGDVLRTVGGAAARAHITTDWLNHHHARNS